MTAKPKSQKLLALCECAIMVALAVVLDLLPLPRWPNGGSLSVSSLPIIFIAYRRGTPWGLAAGAVNSVIQLITGWYAPPAGTVAAVIGCVLLDYILAFTAIGLADIFRCLGGKKRIAGYAIGAVAVNLLRLICSFLSGVLLWGSTMPEGQNIWLYSLTYNAGYMLPNAIVAGIVIALLCTVVDPKTLKPNKSRE